MGGRAALLAIGCAVAALAPLGAQADSPVRAFVPPSLLAAIDANPDAVYQVIVQGGEGKRSAAVASDVGAEVASDPGAGKGLKRKFLSISGVSAELTGEQIRKLASRPGIVAITQDALTGSTDLLGAPANAVPPTVAGAAAEGQTLAAVEGAWTGNVPLTYAYQWQRCDNQGRPAAVLGDSPLGFWRLGDTGATAADASGHGLDGTYYGSVTRGVPGVTGGGNDAAGFGGVRDSVEVPGIADDSFSAGFTLEAWVKLAAPQTNKGIVGKWNWASGGGVLLWIDESGNYSLVVTRDFGKYLTTSIAPTVGQWEHIVGTWDGSILRLYRDGVEIGSRPFAGSVGQPAIDFQIGNYDQGADTHFLSGAVDEAALYGRALSARQIENHYLGCRDVPGATSQTYALTADDLGSTVRVVVTATNAAGSASAISQPTAAVAAPPPVVVAPASAGAPTIAGIAQESRTLTATQGAWTGTDPLAYSYQWRRCDSAGAACTDVGGATSADYTLARNDVGSTLEVAVTASNAAGTSSTSSVPTAVVAALPSRQHWPYVSGVAKFWPGDPSTPPPAIAIVDSGIDASRPDFGGRVIQDVTLTTLPGNSPGDGRGHGTFVASIAAGQAPGYMGAAPTAKLVSLDVMDDQGMGMTSDVIAAVDWIYRNKDTYGIRVVNLSLDGSAPSNFQYDPLDRAIEKLWLSGVVVVAAAGNYAVDGQQSNVPYAPGNDPFVITVGAVDGAGSLPIADDFAAPWSAFGYTMDGFAKPELGAPGRYMVGAVPPSSTLVAERPEQVVEPGYMQLSGTSFSAPVVAGAAADILALHPSWTPDQVKGALMVAAQPLSLTPPLSVGVGEVNAADAAAVSDPPNPNLALNQFLIPDPTGDPIPVFDAAAWGQTAQANAAWGQAAWGQAAWGQAAWGQAAWGQTYWSSAAWGQNGSDNGAGSTAGTGNAEGDALPAGGYWLSPADRAAAERALGIK